MLRRRRKKATKSFVKAFIVSYVVTVGVALYFEQLLKRKQEEENEQLEK
jgi:hypothetical protein